MAKKKANIDLSHMFFFFLRTCSLNFSSFSNCSLWFFSSCSISF